MYGEVPANLGLLLQTRSSQPTFFQFLSLTKTTQILSKKRKAYKDWSGDGTRRRNHRTSIHNVTFKIKDDFCFNCKFCRGDSLCSQIIDPNASVSLPRLSSKTKHFSQERMNRAMTKEQLRNAEGERNPSLDELRTMQLEELKAKDRIIEFLKLELERTNGLEAKLAERDVSLGRLREELSNAKLREGHARDLAADHKRRIHELDDEVENRRLSESRMFDLLASHTKKYEESKIELEECKLEIMSLIRKVEVLEASRKLPCNGVASIAENLEGEKGGIAEVILLKNELKMATEAEEKSRKAMDDLALALKEVATEAAEAKKKCSISELELNHLKEESERMKDIVKNTEQRYENLLDEAKKDTELHTNTIHRLRLEAEESLLAWNGREMGFVSCIKKAEEENIRLTAALEEAHKSTMAAKEETKQVRDILKQAINEANAAKAAADIAREENSQLKDNIVEMEDALQFLSRENERLRIIEAATLEKVDQVKQTTSNKLPAKKQKGMTKPETADNSDKSEDEEYTEVKGGVEHDNTNNKKAAAAKPQSDASVSNNNTEDIENLESHQADQDSDVDKNSHNRRRRALFRKVGDLILRRSFSISRKDPSPEPAPVENSSVAKT